MSNKCLNCNKEIHRRSKRCNSCAQTERFKDGAWNKGLKRWWNSPTQWKKGEIPKGSVLFKKGQISLMKGKKREDIVGENHFNWKGDEAGYGSKHSWIYRRLGKAFWCYVCGKAEKKMYHWANISGEYKRKLDDYIPLCVSHHRNLDMKGVLAVL